MSIPFSIQGRRAGDLAEVFADCKKASDKLDWRAQKTIAQACEDSWKWQNHRKNSQQK